MDESLIWALENGIIEVDEVHYQSFKLTKIGEKMIVFLCFSLFSGLLYLLFNYIRSVCRK